LQHEKVITNLLCALELILVFPFFGKTKGAAGVALQLKQNYKQTRKTATKLEN